MLQTNAWFRCLWENYAVTWCASTEKCNYTWDRKSPQWLNDVELHRVKKNFQLHCKLQPRFPRSYLNQAEALLVKEQRMLFTCHEMHFFPPHCHYKYHTPLFPHHTGKDVQALIWHIQTYTVKSASMCRGWIALPGILANCTHTLTLLSPKILNLGVFLYAFELKGQLLLCCSARRALGFAVYRNFTVHSTHSHGLISVLQLQNDSM